MSSTTQYSKSTSVSQPNNDKNPLLRYLNEENSHDNNGTVPSLPLKSPTQQPITTTKISETTVTQRPNDLSDRPPATKQTFGQLNKDARETEASRQIPKAGQPVQANEVQTNLVEPIRGTSKQIADDINQYGIGPVALDPIAQDESVIQKGVDAVKSGVQSAQNYVSSKPNGEPSQLKQSVDNASTVIKEKSQQAADVAKIKTQQASDAVKDKKQQASAAIQSTKQSTQQQLGNAQQAMSNKIEVLKGRLSDTMNSAAKGVRQTADNISKNETIQQTVPTVVEAATSSYYFLTAFITQYLQSFRPFVIAMLNQPFYVQLLAGLSLLTHGIMPFLYLDKWAAHTVLQCYVLSVFLSHLIFTSTGHLRLLFAAHIAMLPIMWSLFWETESQSAALAELRDQVQAGNAMSLITHPRAIRHYTYVLWTRAVLMVTTAIFTLDFADIDEIWKRSARQRASIANKISKRLPIGKSARASREQLPGTEEFNDEVTFDELPIENENTDYDRLLSTGTERSDEFSSQQWQQNAQTTPFDFDTFMDDSHLTKQTVQTEEKPDKTFQNKLDNFTNNKQLERADPLEASIQPTTGAVYSLPQAL